MEYKVEDTELTLIADAIRSACNLSDELEFPSDFIAKINTLNSAYVGEDESPHLLRQSPTDFGSNYNSEMPTLIGGTIAWNQLVQNGNFADGTNHFGVQYSGYISISAFNGILTVTGLQNSEAWRSEVSINPNDSLTIPANHVGLFLAQANPTVTNTNITVYYKDGNTSKQFSVGQATANSWSNLFGFIKPTKNATSFRLRALQDRYAVNDTAQFKNVMLIDLTATFGTEIADYVYGLEQSTAGSGIAWLKSYGFLTKDYYAYNDGSLVSVKTSEHRTTGKNLLKNNASSSSQNGLTFTVNADGSVRVSGTATASTYKSLNDNFVVPDGNYVLSGMERKGSHYIYMNARRADGGMDYSYGSTSSRENIVADASVHPSYSVGIGVENGTTIDVTFYPMIRRADVSDATYEPYTAHSYPLGNDDLRGIFKLSNGNLYADGDVKTSDGKIQRRYSIVDLGTLDYVKRTTGVENRYRFNVNFPSAKPATSATAQANAVCSKYVCMGGSQSYNYDHDKVFAIDGNGVLNIYDSAYNSSTEEQFKTAMSGVYLVYEKASVSTETADSFTSPQIVSPLGTEEYVDTRDVPVPVGHRTEYDYRREVI